MNVYIAGRQFTRKYENLGKLFSMLFSLTAMKSASESKSINFLLLHYTQTFTEIYYAANNRKEHKQQLWKNHNKKVNVTKTNICKILIIKGLQKIGLDQFAKIYA